MAKILIIEDDQTIRSTLTKRLIKLGYDVSQAENGEVGITSIQSEHPDLVLLDLIMPGKSGFEVLEEIKIKDSLEIPILVISNLDQQNDVETAKNLGASDYILKSNISLNELAAKINSILKG